MSVRVYTALRDLETGAPFEEALRGLMVQGSGGCCVWQGDAAHLDRLVDANAAK